MLTLLDTQRVYLLAFNDFLITIRFFYDTSEAVKARGKTSGDNNLDKSIIGRMVTSIGSNTQLGIISSIVIIQEYGCENFPCIDICAHIEVTLYQFYLINAPDEKMFIIYVIYKFKSSLYKYKYTCKENIILTFSIQ